MNLSQEMNKSGVWRSLEAKETKDECERRSKERPGEASKDNTPDEGIVIKVNQTNWSSYNQLFTFEKTKNLNIFISF